jgi:hypothetical protein
MSQPQPLPADPRRQANAMFAACDYQIWQTVGAWLDLRGDEVLFIEGAEDFDIVGTTKGETTQVKASTAPISLGRKNTQEALNNFWRLKRDSPTISVLSLSHTRIVHDRAGSAIRIGYRWAGPLEPQRFN